MIKQSSILILAMGLMVHSAIAQGSLKVGSGTHMVVNGEPNIVVQEMSWVNDGTFTADSSTVRFTGTGVDSIAGASISSFYAVVIDKTTDSLLMKQDMAVEDTLYFLTGYLNLNGQEVTLGTAQGGLSGESETSRTVGPNGGEVVKVLVLNAPSGENPGNLGAILTTPDNLGTTTIRRGHTAQSLPGGNSINRYYEIDPQNNSGLNASLRLSYFDAELNGISETDLELFRSDNSGSTWNASGFATRDAVANYIQQSGLDQMGRWTASTLSAFPVEWLGFDAWPKAGQVQTQWLTATEINNDYFVVERSQDGEAFEPFATVPAVGNSQTVQVYDALDPNPYQGFSYYRVKQVDLDGSHSYTQQVEVFFESEFQMSLYPNPAENQAWLALDWEGRGTVHIEFLDARGRVVQTQDQMLVPGPNQLPLDVSQLTEGSYAIKVQLPNRVLAMRLVVE